MIRQIVTACVATAVLFVGLPLAFAGYFIGLLFLLLAAASWILGIWKNHSWLATLGLVSLILITAVAALIDLPPILLITAVALALFAWDLGNYGRLLASVPEIRGESGLLKTHVRWAGSMIGFGWLLAIIALNIQLPLNLGWAIGIGAVMVLGLRWLVVRLQHESKAERD